MSIKKIYLLALAVIFSQASFSMDPKKEIASHQTYKGKLINAASLIELQPEMPKELEKDLATWIKQNKALLDATIPLTKNVALKPAAIKTAHKEFKDRLKAYGDKSRFNAALPVEFAGKKYFIKYAGPFNLAYANLHSQNGPDGKPYGWRKLDDFPTDLKPIETYQTISQEAGYLRLDEAVDQNKIQDKFFVPKTWLVKFRGNKNDLPNDENSIIVQEAATDFEPVVLNSETKEINPKFQNVSKEAINAIFIAIKDSSGTLWGIYDNLLINDKGQVVQPDVEQPNNEDARNFYNQNDGKRKHNTVAGLEGAGLICRDAIKQGLPVKNQCIYYKELLLNDPEYGSNKQLQDSVDYTK